MKIMTIIRIIFIYNIYILLKNIYKNLKKIYICLLAKNINIYKK